MEDCVCGSSNEIESGQDVSYNNGFLMKTVEICVICEYLNISYFSMGDFEEGRDYDNYEVDFESFEDEEELYDYIEMFFYDKKTNIYKKRKSRV